MTHSTVAILGGGLAGLNAARLLHEAGVDFRLYEARDRFGGRILTVDAAGLPSEDGFDLGPSWFWPQMQPDIAELVATLGLKSFGQHSTGDVIFERMSREGPRRYPTPPQEATSFRLVGGTAALVHALVSSLPADRLFLNSPVSAMALEAENVRLTLTEPSVTADHVISTLPPRLMQETISFTPAVPPDTDQLWRSMPTWMAPHAKFFAIYDRAFWREVGLSGTAQSMVGPMPEIHDACTSSGQAALFGFLGIGAKDRARLGPEAITAACLQQLERMFGVMALNPRATLIKDWATEALTSVMLDVTEPGHPSPLDNWVYDLWSHRLMLAGSETAAREPGYLSGAVVASSTAVATLLSKLNMSR